MVRLRVALAQVNLTVGDIRRNVATVRDYSRRAADAGADIVAFPEMTITGYPPEDLVYRQSFLDANLAALDTLAVESGDMPTVVGYLAEDGGRRNAAAVLHRGELVARYYKHFLPNYGVFDEQRYFTPGGHVPLLRIHGVDVAVLICEDLWQDGGTAAAIGTAGASLAIVINGSPYEQGKDDFRGDLVARRARECGTAFAYVNTVGGQDELVFDGDSLVVDAGGELLARAPRFSECLVVHDVELPAAVYAASVPEPVGAIVVDRIELSMPARTEPLGVADAGISEPLAEEAEVWGAIVTATRDYVRKNHLPSVVLGLSGGIDSAVVAAIAVDALGADNVHTVALPSSYSSPGSLTDAAAVAARLGTQHSVVPIQPVVEAYAEQLKESGGLTGVAAENIQARVRGTLLMALSNEHGHLVLTTGNKSELATGFTTLYGDSAGGFAPIKDVFKTLVWRLARWRNDEARRRGATAPIPDSVISKPPSAELAPGQLDADRLPPYEILDSILDDYVENDRGRDELVARGHDPSVVARVIQLVDRAEYKRRQYPPGPKISPKNFGRDRRLPITNRFVD